jgi:hypothetical protein
MLSNQIVNVIDPLYLPLEGEDATALATAVAYAAGLPFRQPAEKGWGWGQKILAKNTITYIVTKKFVNLMI